jgi:hypothetical protein
MQASRRRRVGFIRFINSIIVSVVLNPVQRYKKNLKPPNPNNKKHIFNIYAITFPKSCQPPVEKNNAIMPFKEKESDYKENYMGIIVCTCKT